jgi:hypothetical protein
MFFEGEPPRIVRGMGEYFLPTIPFFNVMMQRTGSVVGRPQSPRPPIPPQERDTRARRFPRLRPDHRIAALSSPDAGR